MTAFLLTLVACNRGGEEPAEGYQPERQSAEHREQQSTKVVEETHESQHQRHEGGGSCGSGEEISVAEDSPLTREQAVGGPVSNEVELVDAADLVANPDQYVGRTIRVQGRVKGFCHHQRAWFAIDVPAATPPYVRIVTAPTYLVPSGIMNAQATAVGTVEVMDVPGSRVSHYEREHKLGSGGSEFGRTRRVIIRSTGAVFAPANS